MAKVEYDKEKGNVIPKEYYNLEDCSFDELVQLANHYNQKATDMFYDETGTYTQEQCTAMVSHFLNVSERYSKELKNRAILTFI